MWKLQKDYLAPNFVQFMGGVVEESRSCEPMSACKTYEELLEAELRGV